MRLLLIRHGETDWNVEARIQGLSDVPLNANGLRQAQLLGEALRDEPLAAVYASPLQRAQRTAEMVAAPHGVPVRTHPGLSELNQGVLEGMLLKDIHNHESGVRQAWAAGNLSIVIPGGESLEGLQQRAWAAIGDIRREHEDGAVAVVSHNLTTKAILCTALELPLLYYRRFLKDNGSVTILEFRDTMAFLVRFNDTSHYRLAADAPVAPVP